MTCVTTGEHYDFGFTQADTTPVLVCGFLSEATPDVSEYSKKFSPWRVALDYILHINPTKQPSCVTAANKLIASLGLISEGSTPLAIAETLRYQPRLDV